MSVIIFKLEEQKQVQWLGFSVYSNTSKCKTRLKIEPLFLKWVSNNKRIHGLFNKHWRGVFVAIL